MTLLQAVSAPLLALAEYAVPGAAIALVQDGRLVLAEGFGVRDLATGAPTTAGTVFPLASVSKTFTAAMLAALVDRRKLGWEQPMLSLLPGFRLHDADAGQWLNARDLLSHRAGFRDRPAHSTIGFSSPVSWRRRPAASPSPSSAAI